MCKVFMVAGIKKENVDKVWKFTKAIAKPMSRINDDGLGYAAITAEGKIFGERWLNNTTAFDAPRTAELDTKLLDIFGKVIVEKTKMNETFEYNSFGELDKNNIVAITMHTRAATTPKGLLNTHPFVSNGVSLIHNGVIRNYERFDGRVTTCDSEAILRAYLNEKVLDDISNLTNATKSLEGYYACGVLTNDTEGPILDIFKSVGARLHVAYVQELGAFVVSTDDDDIKNIAKELGYTIGQVFALLPNKGIRVNAITGKEKIIVDFEEHKYEHWKGNNQNFSTTNTEMKNGTSIGDIKNATTNNKVFPFGKKKNSTKISEQMMDYFRSGARTIVSLSDREIQEEIMEQEKHYGNGGFN